MGSTVLCAAQNCTVLYRCFGANENPCCSLAAWLLVPGWETMRGAVAMFYMVQGYSRGLIKFVIITAEK